MGRIIVIILGLLLAACERPATPPVRVWQHSLPGSPADLDPARAADRYSQFLAQNLFQTLYRYQYLARPYQLRPDLAAGPPEIAADGLTYWIDIAPGNRFADDPAFADGQGSEVTAHDVAYSIKRHFVAATRSQGAWLWRDVLDFALREDGCAAICVVSRYRLAIFLKQPYPQLLHTLASPLASVVPRAAIEHYGAEFARHPVGSGPYVIAHFDAFRARLERNPNFLREPLNVDQEGIDPAHPLNAFNGAALPLSDAMEIHFIPDDAARWVAFSTRPGLDFLRLPADQVASVLESVKPPVLQRPWDSDYSASVAPELGFVRLEFNLADPEIGLHANAALAERNRSLRCGVLALDSWERRQRLMYAGMGQVFQGIVPPQVRESGSREWPPQVATIGDYRPALNYGAVAGIRGQQEFDWFRSLLVAAGYSQDQLQYRSYSNLAGLIAAIGANEVNVYMMGWVMDYPDPLNNYQLFYGPNALPGANYSRFAEPQFDAAFAQAAQMPPGAERNRLLDHMDEILARSCVSLSGLARESVFVYRKQWLVEPDNGPVNGTILRFVVPKKTSGQL